MVSHSLFRACLAAAVIPLAVSAPLTWAQEAGIAPNSDIHVLSQPLRLDATVVNDDALPIIEFSTRQRGSKRDAFKDYLSVQNEFLANQNLPTVGQDDDLIFHYAWMQQYSDDYRYREGGAALGRMLRISAQSLYDQHLRRPRSHQGGNDDIVDSFGSDVEYNLRMSGDEIKLGIEYDF